MLAVRAFKRAEVVHGRAEPELLDGLNITPAQVEDMYQTMAIANYEDRFVVPSSHKEQAEDSFNDKSSCGFTFGNGCSGGVSEGSLFGKKQQGSVVFADMPKSRKKTEVAS
jgi:nitrate reductase beta subunit